MNLAKRKFPTIIILVVGCVFALRLSFNIVRLWKTGEKVEQARQELQEAQQEQIELQKKLAQVQSPEFIEKEAREKLGYGREGEIIVILPKAEEQAKAVDQQIKPSWQQWWDLYIGI